MINTAAICNTTTTTVVHFAHRLGPTYSCKVTHLWHFNHFLSFAKHCSGFVWWRPPLPHFFWLWFWDESCLPFSFSPTRTHWCLFALDFVHILRRKRILICRLRLDHFWLTSYLDRGFQRQIRLQLQLLRHVFIQVSRFGTKCSSNFSSITSILASSPSAKVKELKTCSASLPIV